MKDYKFDKRAPSLPTLRKMLKEADDFGDTFVTFEYGEQHSRFEKHNNRWYHYGNGLLKAAYKLEDELTQKYYEARRF